MAIVIMAAIVVSFASFVCLIWIIHIERERKYKMIEMYIFETMDFFDDSYINQHGEIVFYHERNVFIDAKGINSKDDFVLKILVWLSRYAARFGRLRTEEDETRFRKSLDDALKYLIDKKFSDDDYRMISEKIGCGTNTELAQRFKDSGFDMGVLENE